jgi:hypothetical protein
LRGEIALTLASLGLSRPIVEIEVAERLQRDPGPAKLRRFVPLEFRRPHSRDRARSEAQPVLSAAR